MQRSARFWFCLALAIVGAAIADPLVEFASNAGCFGRGTFTDRSTLDVVPALVAGFAVLALYVAAKARALVAGALPSRNAAALLPATFAMQMLALLGMETTEQLVAYGHIQGPWIWLGGPPAASLAVHAVVCVTLAFCVTRCLRRLAAATLHALHFIRRFAPCRSSETVRRARRWGDSFCLRDLSPIPCRIGERAPPAFAYPANP